MGGDWAVILELYDKKDALFAAAKKNDLEEISRLLETGTG